MSKNKPYIATIQKCEQGFQDIKETTGTKTKALDEVLNIIKSVDKNK